MSQPPTPNFNHFTAIAASLQRRPWPSCSATRSPSQLSDELGAALRYYQLPLPSTELQFSSGALTAGTTERLVWYRWQPAQAQRRAVVVHGYFDHTGLYRHLINALLERGCEVVCFDLPGHGFSSGERASIDDFDHYQQALCAVLDLITSWPQLPLIGCGQSTGGAILLQHLAALGAQPSPWSAVNLLAPLFEPVGWRSSRLLLPLLSPFLRTLPRRFQRNSGDSAFGIFLAHQDPLQSRVIPLAWLRAMDRWIAGFRPLSCSAAVNIIQGDRDHTVAWRHNMAHFRRQFSAATITIIEGAGHHLVNETAALRAEVFAQLQL